MSRAQRLLSLLQILRSHRFPVTGSYLASELGISLRTLYRDVGALQKQGAIIEGEPGLGYVLRQGFMLPPLMFSEEEIEALVLGSRWVADRGDERLGNASRSAITKIAAVLPANLDRTLHATPLLIGPSTNTLVRSENIPHLRRAIRAERKIEISYRAHKGDNSTRILWPFALGYFDNVHLLIAWCELREKFRHFRIDRILTLNMLEQRYPRRSAVLLKEWRESEGIPNE